MPKRALLDTDVLVRWWRDQGGEGPLQNVGNVEDWATELLELHDAAGIVSPVYLEMICGECDSRRVVLAERFLQEFPVLDGWQVTTNDLQEALRIAKRVPRDGRRRQFGDCLVRALANRLRYDVITYDQAFPG